MIFTQTAQGPEATPEMLGARIPRFVLDASVDRPAQWLRNTGFFRCAAYSKVYRAHRRDKQAELAGVTGMDR